MTIAELRALLVDLPDDMPIALDDLHGMGDFRIDHVSARVVETIRTLNDDLVDAADASLEELADLRRAHPRRIGPTVLLVTRFASDESDEWPDDNESES